MQRFVFRPINIADISSAVGKSTTDLRLTTTSGGVVAVDTPDLTIAERAALRSLFTKRGYVEDPAVEIDLNG